MKHAPCPLQGPSVRDIRENNRYLVDVRMTMHRDKFLYMVIEKDGRDLKPL